MSLPSILRVNDLTPFPNGPLAAQVAILRETVRRYQDALAPAAVLPAAWNLTPTQQRLLRAIRACGPDVCTKDRAFLALYGCSDDAPDPQVLDVTLVKIRRRLAKARARLTIETIWATGWRMTAESCARFDAAVAADRAAWPAVPTRLAQDAA